MQLGVRILWEVENRMMTDNEVLEFLESNPHKLIVMSGPTQCGKTKIVRSIKSGKTHMIRSQSFSDFVYMMIRCDYLNYNERLLTIYKNYDFFIVEDIDLGAFMAIHRILEFIEEYVKESDMIVTGVEICRWQAFFDFRAKGKAIFVTYCEGEDEFEKI